MTDEPSVNVSFARPFRRALKRLSKKYPHIRDDVQALVERLSTGEISGDQVQSVGYPVYKVRLPNRDSHRGKSGGYRVIYYLRTASQIILLTIYSKSERSDIGADQIQAIIRSSESDENT
jgi:mRNA-degrading endonuclease RelE of RelBE toxin-antitoxin system